VTPAEAVIIRSEIETLLAEFAWRIDHGADESAADLFTPDGWYAWGPDRRSAGRDAIRAAYRARVTRGLRTSRHLVTNLRFGSITADRVEVTSIMTLYAEDGPPPHPANVLMIADFEDVCVRDNGRWLFESRNLIELFNDAGRSAVLPLADSRRKPA